jgi:hypothetical protein
VSVNASIANIGDFVEKLPVTIPGITGLALKR